MGFFYEEIKKHNFLHLGKQDLRGPLARHTVIKTTPKNNVLRKKNIIYNIYIIYLIITTLTEPAAASLFPYPEFF